VPAAGQPWEVAQNELQNGAMSIATIVTIATLAVRHRPLSEGTRTSFLSFFSNF
jgi:hypothetical protein